MNVVREIQKLNEKELARGTTQGSWHDQYKDSAWVYVGGLPYELTEGDVICVMSQWGEIEDLHLVREKDTGKSKGFAFVKYEDQKSTVLAVDNFNGIKLLDRVIRVDHKEKYALPKELLKKEEEMEKEALEKGMPVPAGEGAKWKPGHAYEGKELATDHSIKQGVDLFAPPKDSDEEASSEEESEEEMEEEEERGGGRSSDGGKVSKEEKKARKKEKKARKKEEKKRRKEEKKRHRDEEDKGGRGDKRRREDEDGRRPRGEEREKDDAPWEQVAEIEPLPMLPPEDDGSSWRGRMDPSMRGTEGRGSGRGGGGGGRGVGGPRGGGSMFGRAYSGQNKRGDMSGIAGINRRR